MLDDVKLKPADEKIGLTQYRLTKLDLPGKFLLTNGAEFNCRVDAISPIEAIINCDTTGQMNEHIVLYIKHLGRLEGYINREFYNGFGVKFEISTAKRERLSMQLTWLSNIDLQSINEDRGQKRYIPTNPDVLISLGGDQNNLPAKLIDISLSGAAIETRRIAKVGDIVRINRAFGVVTRQFDRGFAVNFAQDNHSSAVLELAVSVGVTL